MSLSNTMIGFMIELFLVYRDNVMMQLWQCIASAS